MEALGRLSPRFSPTARSATSEFTSSSAPSSPAKGLYAVVHDLTEMEYTCCDPMGFVNQMFTQQQDEDQVVGLSVIEEQQGDYSTNTRSSDGRTREKELDLDEVKAELLTPDLTENKKTALQDSLDDENEIPALLRPASLQYRAVSWDTQDLSTTPKKSSPYHTPVRRHQRAYSEGYGNSWSVIPKVENQGKDKRFGDHYVLTRQVGCSM